jgi:hypothetical protein
MCIVTSQPPLNAPGTDSSKEWVVELYQEMMLVRVATTPDAQTTTVTFSNLMKGTIYTSRVRGVNEFGIGNFSEFAVGQTTTDCKLLSSVYSEMHRSCTLIC